jgi:hypothetical protein
MQVLMPFVFNVVVNVYNVPDQLHLVLHVRHLVVKCYTYKIVNAFLNVVLDIIKVEPIVFNVTLTVTHVLAVLQALAQNVKITYI